jgi:hypothetical protein
VNDARVHNGPAPLSQEQTLQLQAIQELESDFKAFCRKTGSSRELSLAITNMEQAAFWARKHVRGDE